MFNKADVNYLKQLEAQFVIYQINFHDATIHSNMTGHDWVIVSNYSDQKCYILHRHNERDPYHRQKGTYESMRDALNHIAAHDMWLQHKKKNISSMAKALSVSQQPLSF